MSHPYATQPSKAFWRQTISPYHPMDIGDWYKKRYSIDGKRIATAGSCFAQHIGRNLRRNGFEYLDAEPAPATLSPNRRLAYGYDMYSARYGNIYTSRQLTQLFDRTFNQFQPTDDFWEKDGGVVDPFRPTIEPEPFGSVDELRTMRQYHLGCVAELFRTAEVFVFTLGLTETWLSKQDGAAYPLCPGTSGGVFDETKHVFRNLSAREVRADMETFIANVRKINPTLKIFLTVSPVALMATATQAQVAVATAYSKSVLRAVTGELYDEHDFVDYFPSYEIITSPFMKGYFLQPDQREVSPHGVAHVMSVFFSQHAARAQGRPAAPSAMTAKQKALAAEKERDDVMCDEELLSAFERS